MLAGRDDEASKGEAPSRTGVRRRHHASESQNLSKWTPAFDVHILQVDEGTACCGTRKISAEGGPKESIQDPHSLLKSTGAGGPLGLIPLGSSGGDLGGLFAAKIAPGQLVVSDPAFKGDLESVRQKFAGNTEELDADGNSPVHWAAVKGHTNVVEFLISKRFPVGTKNKDGDTPLHWAASGGHDDAANMLIDAGADVWAKNKDGTTPLHFAAAEGRYDVVALLCQYAGPPQAPSSQGRQGRRQPPPESPLNSRTQDLDTPLHWAVASGNDAVVEELVRAGADPNSVNKDGNTPLHVACAEGAVEVVQVLLENKADPDVQNNDSETAVHWACSGGHRQILATLLDNNAQAVVANKFSEHPIHFAVQKGGVAMVEILHEHGADAEAKTQMQDTCLHLAVARCDVHMVSKLIAMGVNLNTTNKMGDSVLHSACSIGDLSTVQMLVENKAKVNVTNGEKETPLHWAASAGHPVVVRYLLQHGADPKVLCTPRPTAPRKRPGPEGSWRGRPKPHARSRQRTLHRTSKPLRRSRSFYILKRAMAAPPCSLRPTRSPACLRDRAGTVGPGTRCTE